MAVCSSKMASDRFHLTCTISWNPWNVIPGKLGVDLHLHRVHIPLVSLHFVPTLYRFFIARQHAMHAERDIVLPHPSVSPSHSGTVSKRTHIISLALFLSATTVTKFRWEPISWVLNTQVRKICDF